MVLRPLLVLACLASVMLVALNLLASKLGSLQPPSPALAGFVEGCEDKPQPCWYGIVPGVTTANETLQIIDSLGYELPITRPGHVRVLIEDSPLCSFEVWDDGRMILAFQLDFCHPDVQVGDVIAFMDLPRGIVVPLSEVSRQLLFKGSVSLEAVTLSSPYSRATRISTISPRGTELHAWHGFIAPWRYCQLEPETRICP